MRTLAVVGLLVLALAVTAFAGDIGPGTIETGFGGSFHLSPEPWQLMANMYLVYYFSPMMAIGPFWELEKTGDCEVCVEELDTDVTYKSAWHYRLGILAKMYLPIVMAEGRMRPYVMGGFGMVSLPKEWTFSGDTVEEETESKPAAVFEVAFDYFITDTWSLWAGYRGAKIFADEDTYFDMNDRDMTDLQSSIELGVSHFIMR
jgi:hypothetical protein